MCARCDEAGELLALSEAEEGLILAEAEDGLNITSAVRPLTAAERRAGTRFGEIEALHNGAEVEALGILSGLETTIEAAIAEAFFGDGDTATAPAVLRSLATINAAQPKSVQEAASTASSALAGLYAGVYAAGAAIVLQEAIRQGSKPAARASLPDRPVSDFAAPAASAAMYPWTRTTGKLQATLGTPGAVVGGALSRADLSRTLAGISLDGALDTARQGINQAHGLGRADVAETLEPDEIWASELLDGATCGPCQAVDGKDYSTLAEAREDYPHGGYVRCDGDARCRGTLVYIFPEGQDAPPPPPNLVPAPDPKPPAPVAPTPPPGPAPAPAVAPVVAPTTPKAPDSHNLPEPTPEAVAARPRRAKGQPQRFDRMDQLPVKDPGEDLGHQLDDAHNTNPEFDRSHKTRIYNNNCTHVTAVYELRRRGYDVTAAPVKGGHGRYDSDFLPFWNNPTTGRPPAFRKHPDEAALADDILTNEPDGARGIIKVIWKDGGGHVFNYERVGPELRLIEAQNGKPDASEYFKDVKKGSIAHYRTDHLEPTDKLAKDAAQTRPAEYRAEVVAKKEADKERARMDRATKGGTELVDGKWTYNPPTHRKEGRKYVQLTAEERADMKRRVEALY